MYKRFFKRLIDFCIVFIVLVSIWPILLIVTIWLHFVNKGAGAFFFQERPGKGGKIFKIVKFKTMTDECDVNGNLLPDEMRLTKVGKFVRSTSIDELPQFWNVFKGDMSIIGPRPHMLVHDKEYMSEIATYSLRYAVKPGITGWAQVNGLRGERDIKRVKMRVDYDLWYIQHWSLGLDIKIMLRTIGVMIKK